MADPPVLWTPPDELVESCTMTRFKRWVCDERGLQLDTYEDLWQWSVDDLEAFWSSIWTFFDVTADAAPMRVLGSREMPGAEWFSGARLNYAEHLLGTDDDLGMDIALGRLGGSRTILVRTGTSGSVDLERVPERRRPDAVVDGVGEVLPWL